MKILLLYKGVLNLTVFDTIYREPLEKRLSTSITFNISALPREKKPLAQDIREWFNMAFHILVKYDYILVSDAHWFKVLTKGTKAETTLGTLNIVNNHKIFYCPSPFIHQIDSSKFNRQLTQTYDGLLNHIMGKSTVIEPEILFEAYPNTISDIEHWLTQLKSYPMLYCDIETKGFKVTEAGIYTIGFSWSKHAGIAFPVDAHSDWAQIRKLLAKFFEEYTGKLVFHKANFDVYMLVYNLFQTGLDDIEGQLYGLKTLFKNGIEDTLVIAYLATNSCSGNSLSLKELAQPYAGNWAVEVKDVTKVDLDKLLKYNLIDCLSTCYVYETYYPIMVQEKQEDLYYSFMLPTLETNIRCQLNGLPINLDLVAKFKANLIAEKTTLLNNLKGKQAISNAEYLIASQLTEKRNAKLKVKVTTIDDNRREINFNSSFDLSILVHEVMQLPVIETTPTGQSSLGKDILRDLVNHTENQDYKDILTWIAELYDIEKILTAFIPAFESAPVDSKGNAHLLGFFNLCGTVSGRLSSSQINLQQLPSTGSRFSKPTKKCFVSTDEWLFVGIDFSSLEDRISALTTKDENKLKVYTDHYDGHCLRAYQYFQNEMPDIVEELIQAKTIPERVEIINSIATRYKTLRNLSKAPTFALTYGGVWLTLVKQCGFTEELAKQIEHSYHELYKTSDEWVQSKIQQACIDGYVTTGFGLKVRTPILKQLGYEKSKKDKLASAEARTAGNALGQGWGVLNDRAMNAVLAEVDKQGLSQYILPVAKIHDACYYLVRNDTKLLHFLNELVVKEAQWNNHPDIYHEEVGLSGQLDIFYSNWATPLTLPEVCTEADIIQLANKHKESL